MTSGMKSLFQLATKLKSAINAIRVWQVGPGSCSSSHACSNRVALRNGLHGVVTVWWSAPLQAQFRVLPWRTIWAKIWH